MATAEWTWKACRYVAVAIFLSTYLLCTVSQLTMPATSVDRLLVLLLEMRCKQVVTLERVYFITITFCVVFTASSTISLVFNPFLASWCDIKVVSLCLAASFYTFMKFSVNVADIIKIKYNSIFKSHTSTRCGPTLVVEWVLIVVNPLFKNPGINTIPYSKPLSLLYLNSSFNPILYCS